MIRLGCLGRFSWEKNFVAAVASIVILPAEVTLMIAGAGPDGEVYARAARSWGVADRVRVVGPVARVAHFLSEVDLLVVPSIFEATPSVVAEAMVRGVPVAATRVGDLPAILGGGRGILLEDPSPEAIADGIGRVLADRSRLLRMSIAGRAFALEYLSAARMARGWEAAIATAMGWG